MKKKILYMFEYSYIVFYSFSLSDCLVANNDGYVRNEFERNGDDGESIKRENINTG
ncbi:MAG: hypothetical protein ACLTTH_02560 [Holdemanella porci]